MAEQHNAAMQKTISMRRPLHAPAHGSRGAIPAADPIFSDFADDPEMLELIGKFVADLAIRVADLESLLQKGDVPGLSRLAHQIKGAAGGYGFGTITDAARVVEDQAKASAPLPAISKSLTELTDLCRRAIAGQATSGAAANPRAR